MKAFHLLSLPGPSLLSCLMSYAPPVPQLPQARYLWSVGPTYHYQSFSGPIVDSTVRIPTLVSNTRSSSAHNMQYTPSLPPLYTDGNGWSSCQHPAPRSYPQPLPLVVQQSASSSHPPALPWTSLVSQPAYSGLPVAQHSMYFSFIPPSPQEFCVPNLDTPSQDSRAQFPPLVSSVRPCRPHCWQPQRVHRTVWGHQC